MAQHRPQFTALFGICTAIWITTATLAQDTTREADQPAKSQPTKAKAAKPTLNFGNPPKLAWQLFAEVFSPDSRTSVPAWETWASNFDTFPAKDATTGKVPQPQAWDDVQSMNRGKESASGSPTLIHPGRLLIAGMASNPKDYVGSFLTGVREEVRRNQTAYEYIAGYTDPNVKLYSQEQLGTMLGLQAANDVLNKGDLVRFPIGAIEVKGEWALARNVPGGGERHYTAHFTTNGNDETYALVGFHIMKKLTTDFWFWATWEHKDNPLLGKQYPQLDDKFGFPKGTNTPSAELAALLKKNGVNQPELTNYRASSWQQLDTTGQQILPPVASNSIIEASIYSKSLDPHDPKKVLGGASCVACHMRARLSVNTRSAAARLQPSAYAFPSIDSPASDYLHGKAKTISATFDVSGGNFGGSVNTDFADAKGNLTVAFPKTTYLYGQPGSLQPPSADLKKKFFLNLDRCWSIAIHAQ